MVGNLVEAVEANIYGGGNQVVGVYIAICEESDVERLDLIARVFGPYAAAGRSQSYQHGLTLIKLHEQTTMHAPVIT
jgi:hypothetical protein